MRPALTAIELHDVGKRYWRVADRDLLVKRLLPPWRTRSSELWALRDINFSCSSGETLGIIGRNGSGKTTLLRLLCGVSAPTMGRVMVRGRIAPLIGIGVGFNQELTGRENVEVNGRLLGLSQAQVRARFESIVDFSEIDALIDTPVKFYSSGMFLRLAFAVAVHTDPEVLLVDEVLAVGDLGFQLKCDARMRDIQAGGATIVIVTHNLGLLERLASRVLVLSHGRIAFDGDTDQAIGRYHEIMQVPPEGTAAGSGSAEPPPGKAPPAAVQVSMHRDDGSAGHHFAAGERLLVRATATFRIVVPRPRVGIMVWPTGLGACYTTHTHPGAYRAVHGPDRPLDVEIALTNRLLSGSYNVSVGVFGPDGTEPIAISPPATFYVSATPEADGFVDLAAEIRLDGQPVPRPTRAR